jgi:hypothetical protein
MILTLKFSGFGLGNCNILKNNQLFASLKKGIFSSKMQVKHESSDLIIKEKDSDRKMVQIFNLGSDQPVAETTLNGKEDLFKDSVKFGSTVAYVTIGENEFALLEMQAAPSQFVWVDRNKKEVIHYDITNLEKIAKKPLKFGCYSMSFVPDAPGQEHLLLLFMGIYLLQRSVLK